MVFIMFSRGKLGIYKLSRAGIAKRCDFEGSVEQSMAFTVFGMVFTSLVELAFRRDAILKAQSSNAWYLLCLAWCLQAQSSWLFDVTAILKAQSSKAWHLLCLARLSRAGSVFSKAQSSWRRLSSKALYLLCLARLIRRLSRAKHGIYCV